MSHEFDDESYIGCNCEQCIRVEAKHAKTFTHAEECDCCVCDEPQLHALRNCSTCTPEIK